MAHGLLREWEPEFALVRTRCSRQATGQLEDELQRVRRIARDAIDRLERAGEGKQARRLRAALKGRRDGASLTVLGVPRLLTADRRVAPSGRLYNEVQLKSRFGEVVRGDMNMTASDWVLGDLPVPDPTLLIESPIVLAVAEFRFLPAGPLPNDAGLRLRDYLSTAGFELPKIDKAQQGVVSINLEEGAQPTVQERSVGWQLSNTDGNVVILMPNAVVAQTTAYSKWGESLRPLLEAALEAAGKIAEPSVVSRVGLRYVNRFKDDAARNPNAWFGRIDPSLLAPIQHPSFGTLVRSAQQQIDLVFDPMRGATLRHGPFVDEAAANAVSYIVDIDVFDQNSVAFDSADLAERADLLNHASLSLFQSCLRSEYLRSLQPQQETAATQGEHP